MFLYITLGTNNLPAAKRFYDAVMPTLGHGLRATEPDEVGYGLPAPARIQFWVTKPYNGQPASTANGAMPAFAAPSRAAVDAFHVTGLVSGGTDEGAPGLRPYGANFYACYLRDPDGNKISAVCDAPEDP